MTFSPLVIARTPLRRWTKQSSWIVTPDSVGLAMTGVGHVFS